MWENRCWGGGGIGKVMDVGEQGVGRGRGKVMDVGEQGVGGGG